MLLIDNETVEKILDMKACMEALETGYRRRNAGLRRHGADVSGWQA
ncbi:MAG: hypothetical protein HY695_33880 [Deltaproteobacteria bacterium]|nr:hypothetical protein [Deltaproteobacteria bacterium]